MSTQPKPINIPDHLDGFQRHLYEVLLESLPAICAGSPDWWQVLVRSARLSGSQSKGIKAGSITELGKLDLVSLCSVLKHNWRAVTEHRGIDDDQRVGGAQCEFIIKIRNQLSHMGADGAFSQEDTMSALLSLKKMCQLLEAPPVLLKKIDKDLKTAMAGLTGTEEQAPEEVSSEATPSPSPAEDFEQAEVREMPLPPQVDQGIPLEFLTPNGKMQGQIEEALLKATYVGIDFGTSTTVASRVFLDPKSGTLKTQPIPIPQKDITGRTNDNHLVPTCVAWSQDKLLVGQGAADLKPELSPGENIWSSFKMELGIDLGPKYYRSKLNGKVGPVEIRKPQDVATCFFKYLREHIEEWIGAQGLPGEIHYAVSVPASFEPNQRLDLCRVMEAAGIQVQDSGIIDEPNAAFVSYLLDTLDTGDGIVKSFGNRARKVLVFDFGAGTCDISILDVGCTEDRLVSRNLAISQFRALGGDNIDRCIAKQILWPAMEQDCAKGVHIRSTAMEQVILPRLQPAAEQLKIQCCRWLTLKTQGGDVSCYEQSDQAVSVGPVKSTVIGEVRLELETPTISIDQFYEVMRPFLDSEGGESTDSNAISIFEPIGSALRKAGISKDDLSMVLFIGGSAQNPLVQDAVIRYMGRFVECVIGQDVRTPVSRGAALHSLALNGLGMQFIKPITSESIYVLTRGNNLHCVMPAGTPIPSPEVVFSDALVVPSDQQSKVELPICVSNASKILHLMELTAKPDAPFRAGDRITLSCRLDENKLLHVTAKLGSVMTQASLSNPLSNDSLTPEETRRLIARQKLNESIVNGGGKPEPVVLAAFAKACADSGFHLDAAESYEALEKISKRHGTPDNATQICYHYAMANKSELSDEWGEESYRRKPTWVSAYNMAIARRSKGKRDKALTLLEEALSMAPDNPSVLESLGREYIAQGDKAKGDATLRAALEQFKIELRLGSLEIADIERAERVARAFSDQEMLKELTELRAKLALPERIYDEKNLAASIINQTTIH